MKSLVSFLYSLFFLWAFLFPSKGWARLNVLTTTSTLKSIVGSIGKEWIHVDSIAKGPENPHFLEAKPSYMVKGRRADLLLAVGLELEVGWLFNILMRSKNPRIMRGQPGYLDVSEFIKPLGVKKGRINRFEGDVHSLGNPHFLLDPIRALEVAKGISKWLSERNGENAKQYQKNVQVFEKKILQKISKWKKRIKRSGIQKVITYHKTLDYFLKSFDIKLAGTLEPKPGIPPTAKHILSLLEIIRKERVSCILIESFFETRVGEKIQKRVPVSIETVPVEVEATEGAKDYESLIEEVVRAVENCKTQKSS